MRQSFPGWEANQFQCWYQLLQLLTQLDGLLASWHNRDNWLFGFGQDARQSDWVGCGRSEEFRLSKIPRRRERARRLGRGN